MKLISFQDKRMRAIQTAPNGVVNQETVFAFRQFNRRVLASYAGGQVRRGMLVGGFAEGKLRFSYAQEDLQGIVQGGSSECEIRCLADGRLQLLEYFDWQGGKGLNIIEECLMNDQKRGRKIFKEPT